MKLLKTTTLAAALVMAFGAAGSAALARDGSADDGGRDDGGRDDGGRDDGGRDGDGHGGGSHDDGVGIELSCVEANAWGGRYHVVEVAELGGRLIATVSIADDWGTDRVLVRAGVDLRPAGGRDLDRLYVGRNIKVAVDSYSGDGLLDYTLNGRRTRVALTCY